MKMDPAAVAKYKQTMACYMPLEAVDEVFDFFNRYSVHFHITRERHSKLGDYRWPQRDHNFHEISVNGNLNKYYFLLVLLHEMAHLNCHQRFGCEVLPHGHEWQEEYRQLLLQYRSIFPPEVAVLIDQYTRRIPLSRTLANKIEAQLRSYDEGYNPSDDLTLDQLPEGSLFRLQQRPEQLFRSVEKRRTRWLCEDAQTRMQYLIRGSAQVVKVDN